MQIDEIKTVASQIEKRQHYPLKEEQYMESSKTSTTLDSLIGYNVNLYVGEEVSKGKLIGVESDHLILENENNYVFYYSIDQIQAITKNTKQFQGEEITTQFLKTHSLLDLLNSLKQSWVTILCLNKQKFNGVLSELDANFVTLINGEERIFIKINNISNVLKGYIKDNENSNSSNEENNQENNQANNQENNQNNKKNKKNERKDQVAKKESDTVENNVVTAEVTRKVEKSESEHETSRKVEKSESEHETSRKVEKSESEHETSRKVEKSEFEHETSSKVEKSEVSLIVEMETPTKVWSQSIKIEPEKNDDAIPQKLNNVLEKQKDDSKQNTKKSEKKQETNRKQPVVSESKNTPTQNKQEMTKQKEQEMTKQKEPAFTSYHFAGEPISTPGMERPSIFSGWPNRRNRTRN